MLTTLYIHFSNAQGQLTQLLVMGCGRNSNSFMLLWFDLIPARMMKIYSKMKAPECSQHFSHYKSMEIFSRAANSMDPGQILPNFEPIQAFIAVLVTCKNEYDSIKMKGLECSHYTFIFQMLKGS